MGAPDGLQRLFQFVPLALREFALPALAHVEFACHRRTALVVHNLEQQEPDAARVCGVEKAIETTALLKPLEEHLQDDLERINSRVRALDRRGVEDHGPLAPLVLIHGLAHVALQVLPVCCSQHARMLTLLPKGRIKAAPSLARFRCAQRVPKKKSVVVPHQDDVPVGRGAGGDRAADEQQPFPLPSPPGTVLPGGDVAIGLCSGPSLLPGAVRGLGD